MNFQTDGKDWSQSLLKDSDFVPRDKRLYVILTALVQQSKTDLGVLSGLWVQRTFREKRWLYFEARRGDERDRELYDLKEDPTETTNIIAEYEELADWIAKWMGWPEMAWLEDYDEEAVLDRLRAVGYAQ